MPPALCISLYIVLSLPCALRSRINFRIIFFWKKVIDISIDTVNTTRTKAKTRAEMNEIETIAIILKATDIKSWDLGAGPDAMESRHCAQPLSQPHQTTTKLQSSHH